jgi:diguanylate cyclase (GGDEF)-like protein
MFVAPMGFITAHNASYGPLPACHTGYRFLKRGGALSRQGPEKLAGDGDVLTQKLQKEPRADAGAELSAVHENLRLRLAAQAAGAIVFDWNVADGTIVWDGAIEALPLRLDNNRAQILIDSIPKEKRGVLQNVLDTSAHHSTSFQIEVEISSAMGALNFTMVGSRIPGKDGRTERLIGMLRETTERAQEIQRLTYLATRDELTGHLNRNALRAELAVAIDKAKDENRHCAFLVASVDRLAIINDSFGFDAGEEVIVGVGERLARALRGSDIIGRTAGNKFGVILRYCKECEVEIVAARLRAGVRDNAIETCGGQVAATCSVGAVWLPGTAANSQEAMLRAEEALDRARERGRDGYSVYERSPQRETGRLRQMNIADEIVAALKENRLRAAYQPIIGAKSRRVAYYECLLRLIRPDGQVMTAGYFVPAAEQMGIVHLADRFALETAIAALKAQKGITLAVNVSGTAADDPAWLQSFVDYIRENGGVAGRLIVELTETAALHHFEENARFITQLRELGVRVAIDDFGAGYTSFRNLQMLHVDTVKIDGSYVENLADSPENQVFVRTLVGLAKNLGLKTVAEWVGSDADAGLLQSFGVDYFQGFHFGEPVLDPAWSKA